MARARLHETLSLPAEPDSVAVARGAMGLVAEDVGAPVWDVKLAVAEAVSNAVTHAFRDGASGGITVEAMLEGDRLRIMVADDGIGMTPNLDSKGLGLGLSLITKVASEVSFDSSEDGTAVIMSFEVDPEMVKR